MMAAVPCLTCPTAHAAPGDLDTGFVNSNVNDVVYATALQADGKSIIGGIFTLVGATARNCVARLNADGTLDASFNPNANAVVYCAAVQPDGKILIGGNFTTVGGTSRIGIARLNADGTLDAAFNPVLGGGAGLRCVAIQADGKILIGGGFTTVNGTSRSGIARLNVDGTLDASFINANPDNNVDRMGLQSDGKIFISGFFNTVGGTARTGIARLNADGTLEAGFNPNIGGSIFSLAVQADGKLLLGGSFTTVNSTTRNRIARLDADGTLDTGFNPNADSSVYCVSTQADGKILLSGKFSTVGGTARSYVARLNAGGTLDTGFIPANVDDWTYSIMAQSDGKVFLGGTFHQVGGVSHEKAARLLNDTATQTLTMPDSTQVLWSRGGTTAEVGQVTFELSTNGGGSWTPLGAGVRVGTSANWQLTGLSLPASGMIRVHGLTRGGYFDGSSGIIDQVLTYPPQPGEADSSYDPNADDLVQTATVQPDGRTIVGGNFVTIAGTARNYLARLNADGSIDSAFNANVGGGAFNFVDAVAVQADGKIVVGGGFTSVGATARNNLARLNADGTLDTGFNPSPSSFVEGLVIQPDGKILVCGGFTTIGGGSRPHFARLNIDGTLDTGFTANVDSDVISMGLQSDGRIVIGGDFLNVGGVGRNRIARVNGDGTLDNGFNPGTDAFVYCVVVQPDGKIVIGGYIFNVAGVARHRVARLNSDGTLDTGFNPDVGGSDPPVRGLALQADGKILLGGGFTTVGGVTRNRAARVNADGTLDSTFNPNANNIVYGVTLQGDGKALACGTFTTIGGAVRNRFARLANDTATQTLTAPSSAQVLWSRGGSAPDVTAVTFERSIDGGVNWTPLGNGARVGTGANWQLTGLALPGSGQLRARGRTTGGSFNGSAGLVEQVASYVIPVVPSVALTSLTGLTGAGVTLNGTVNPNGTATTAQFEYGLTTSYGSTASVALSPNNDSAIHAVSATLNGLTAGTLYHYRLTATNGAGPAATSDGTFTTLSTVTVVFNAATDVPVTGNGYTATGTLGVTLNFAPVAGTNLTVVNNTGLGFISGTFSNLNQGQAVALTYNGITYNFVATYYGGTGNDLVLVWARNRLASWGANGSGQLGNGQFDYSSTNPATVPTAVTMSGVLAGKTILSVASGSQFCLALSSDGTVAGWGFNFGALGNNDPADSPVPVAMNTASGVSALFGKTVIAVAAGGSHSLMVCSDGTVAACGNNANGQLGNNSTTRSLVPVAVNTTSGVSALFGKTVIAVAGGDFHSLALCSDGTMAAWGANGFGQLGNQGTTQSLVPVAVSTVALAGKTVVGVAAGSQHSLAWCSDGSVFAWGYNANGQLGTNSTVDSYIPVPVATAGSALAGKIVTRTVSASDHAHTLSTDGTSASWGKNANGQLGNNSTAQSNLPVAVNASGVLAGKTATGVAAGASHALAVCSDGTMASWGSNSSGQLGAPLAGSGSLVPVLVDTTSFASGERFVSAASGLGSLHNVAIVAVPALADLSNLVLSAGSLSPAFAGATTSYTATVSSATASVTVTPTVLQAGTTVKVNGVTVASGGPSGSIALAVGNNTIAIVCTTQDGSTTKTYNVVVRRLAGAGGTTTANLLVNPGGETGALSPWTVGGTSNPHLDNGTFDPGTNPHTGTYDFVGGNGASGTLSQTVSITGFNGITNSDIDGGFVSANLNFWGLSWGASDRPKVTLNFLNASSGLISSVSSPEITAGTWTNDVESFPVPSGTRFIEYQMVFTRYSGGDIDAFADDNSLTVTGPGTPPPAVTTLAPTGVTASAATLNGTVNPNGTATTAQFQYGLTTSYGSTASVTLSPNNDSAVHSVSAALSSLAANTTYHYRATASSSAGPSTTGDATFTTLSADSSGPTGGTMTLSPPSPFDPSTALTVTFANWTDPSTPLTYAVLVDSVIVSVQGSTAVRNFTGPTATGTHTLKGRIFDSLNNMTEVTQNFTVSTPSESWRQFYFGTTGNSGNAADSADPDRDGMSNFLEFAMHLVPITTSTAPIQATRVGSNVEFTYTRSKAAMNDGCSFIVEWIDTLATGGWSTGGVNETILSQDANVQNIKATLPAGTNGRRFVHLKVARP